MFAFLPNAGSLRAPLLLLLVLLGACSTKELLAPWDSAPVQSANDKFSYRLVTLDNGLKALLISDPATPKAAASLDVQVGSGDNPSGRGGLAHFLEHMLFLGTEKYPDAAEYERYITEHGGSRNAYTSFEHTNYFFDINADHLTGALDRFAQFFISPSFDAQYVERERNAVQAEYQMGLNNDARRGLDVLQASMNPQHPFSQFSVGSLESLADREGSTIREELIEFYERHYGAEQMRLVVLGRESLDELEQLVTGIFTAVPAGAAELPLIEEPIFVDAQLPMFLKVQPLATQRQLQLNFPIADYRSAYRSKPMGYLSNLVGHEGEGSLLSALKAAGLADGLSAGSGLHWRGGAIFSVTISLTEKGVAEYETVLQQSFAYLAMLRQEPPQEWLYKEQASLAAQAFRFREPSTPIGYVSSLSNAMHYYEDEDILRGPYLMADFDPQLIAAALEQLRPQRAQVVLTAPEVSTDKVSPYYGVAYGRLGPEAVMLSRWQGAGDDALALPAPNPFIAQDLDLVPLEEGNGVVPTLVMEKPRQRIWFRQAETFRVPRGAMYVNFRSPLVGDSARDRAASTLYTRMVTDALNEYTYPALLAGLGFDFYRHSQGISMRISGYSDKQFALLEELLGSIAEQSFDTARFERLRRDMVLALQNKAARRPTSQLLDELRRSLLARQYDEAALIAALEALAPSELDAYRKEFWASARAEALLFGNYAPSAAPRLSSALDGFLPAGEGLPALAPEVLKVHVEEPLALASSIEHNDAVVAWYLQGEGQSMRDRAMVALTAQISQSGFFQQLRTEQQLGYIVSSFSWSQFDVPGLMLLVQSPSHDAAAVQDAMDTFLKEMPASIDEEQFSRHRQALIDETLKPHKNLAERAEFYWQAIATRDKTFSVPQQMVEAIEGISFGQWQIDFERQFLNSRRSLLSFSVGSKAEAPATGAAEVFTTPAALRMDRESYVIPMAPL